MTIAVPAQKKFKAINQLKLIISKKKATILSIQRLTATLNFLNKAIVPGRAFTRRMYNKLTFVDKEGRKLKQHYHVALDREFIQDCKVWLTFLEMKDHISSKLCRPFLDLHVTETSETLDFYSDASASKRLGMGAIFGNHYLVKAWDNNFIDKFNPSIQFLEMYALVVAVLTWGHALANMRVEIFCDNIGVHAILWTNTAQAVNTV